MAGEEVLVIGCGIAGPVIALLLQQKGYTPVVFEKVEKLGDAGASLMLSPNGMKVLGLLGLHSQIYDRSPKLEEYRDSAANGDLLGRSDIPSRFEDRYGYPAAGIRRTELNLMLRDELLRSGIEVREGWGLQRIEEHPDAVTAHFTNGNVVSGSMLIGCDGIKSASRTLLLQSKGKSEPEPDYTGLSQTAGISPTPVAFTGTPNARNWYGNGIHMIAYPVSPTHTSWAVTRPEREQTKETWRLYDALAMVELQAQLKTLLEGFDRAAVDLVESPARLTKYGLFDRPGLSPENWYSERCVLLGDAAHPTSPHLGQGANQALEDCYHLSRILPDFGDGSHALENLQQHFEVYANRRQPRTAALVKGARSQGEKRVASGKDRCEERDRAVADQWKDEQAIQLQYDNLFRDHPYNAKEAALGGSTFDGDR